RIVRLDTTRAQHARGVLFVMSHLNAPSLPQHGLAAINPPAGRVLSLFQDDVVHYHGQPIAVVAADTLEHAVSGAALIRATYSRGDAVLDFERAKPAAYAPKKAGRSDTDKKWGDLDAGLAAAEAKVDAVYTTPMQTHNPMEPHATLAHWEGDRLTLYDA